MNGSSSGGGGGDTSSNGSGDISSLAYDMVFLVGFVFLVLLVSLSSYLCVRANRLEARIMLRRLDPGSAGAGGGIDEATIRSYPMVLFSSVKAHGKSSFAGSSDDVDGDSCSICLGEYKECDLMRLLPECGHFFHVMCVDPWLRLHATCPVCRKSPAAVAIRVDGDSHGGDR